MLQVSTQSIVSRRIIVQMGFTPVGASSSGSFRSGSFSVRRASRFDLCVAFDVSCILTPLLGLTVVYRKHCQSMRE